MAMSTVMALMKDPLVTIDRGVMPSFTSSTMRRPVALAISSLRSLVASEVAQPVRLIPIASVRQAMVFAVNNPEQEPSPGHAAHSTARTSSSVALPALCAPSASNTLWRSFFSPSRLPASIGPPVSMMAGMFILPAAISIPGVTLSQFVTPTHPSKVWALFMTSTQSAITSLDGREKRMPAWPMAMPSHTAGTPKEKGTPPASTIPFLTSSTRRSR